MKRLYELANSRPGRVLAAALFLAPVVGGGVAACASKPAVPIERCYDKPQERGNIDIAHLPPLNLAANRQGVVTGDYTTIPPSAQALLDGSLAKVSYRLNGETFNGSGFFTRDAAGNLIAVTAAHIVAGKKRGDMNKITVTDAEGRSSAVKAGCYMSETDLGFAEPADDFSIDRPEGAKRIDVAALVLEKNIGATAINVGNGSLERGQWYTTRNYGGSAGQARSTARQYNVCLLTKEDRQGGAHALSGIEPFRGPQNFASEAGASGGILGLVIPARNNQPATIEAAGVITGTSEGTVDPQTLEGSLYGTTLTAPGAQPHVDIVTPALFVTAAVNVAAAHHQ